DEQRSLAEPVAVAVRSVAARHRPLRLEVREQGKVQLALVGERPVAPRAIHRDAEELGAVARELGEDLVVQRHLIAADGTPVRGIKRQDDRLAAVVAQRDGLIRRAVEREGGCLSPGRERTSTPLFASIPSARCASRSSGTFCPATPMRPRRILPCRISWPVTTFAVLMPTAKQIPWAGRITAVLTPTTRPRASTSGPPELPG